MTETASNIAITDWVNEYSESLYNWAFYKTSNKELSEDLVQDTFIAAIQQKANFKEKSNPKTWLLSVLNNKIVDYYRKKNKSIEVNQSTLQNNKFENNILENYFSADGSWLEKNSPLHWDTLPETASENKAFSNALDNCMQNLPDNWQEIMYSKYIQEKKGPEICQELEISSTNYWQILHRSKLQIRECLNENWFNK